jgi:hypothetical protein
VKAGSIASKNNPPALRKVLPLFLILHNNATVLKGLLVQCCAAIVPWQAWKAQSFSGGCCRVHGKREHPT